MITCVVEYVIDAGQMAIVGLTYALSEGRAGLVNHIGDIGQ